MRAKQQCSAITAQGTRCPTTAVNESNYCFSHDPELAEKRHAARVKGGYGKRNENRARKAIPADLRDVADILLGAIRDAQSGDLDTSKANAIATLSRAYVAVYESGLIEGKIKELESRLAERAQEGKAA